MPLLILLEQTIPYLQTPPALAFIWDQRPNEKN
jgi:hypothetical protein